MINKLRKKMIWVSITSLVLVFVLIFSAICIIGTQQLNSTLDMLTDRISAGGGIFLPFDKDNPRPPDIDRFPGFFTAETPFSTRFFVVQYDKSCKIDAVNTDFVSSVSQTQAKEYAAEDPAARRCPRILILLILAAKHLHLMCLLIPRVRCLIL